MTADLPIPRLLGRIPWFVFVISSGVLLGTAHALDVQVRGKFTASGAGGMSIAFGAQHFPETPGDPIEGVISLSPDIPYEVMVATTGVSSYEVRFAPPSGYQMIIEDLRRNTFAENQNRNGPLRVVLVKGASNSNAYDPLGDASSILWHPPRVSPEPSWPFMRFSLGVALNGEALPALVIPLRSRDTSSDDIPVPTLPEMFYEGSPHETELKAR